MSERRFTFVIAWALICAFTVGVIVGCKYMKRWQDEYYAAHPIFDYEGMAKRLAKDEGAFIAGQQKVTDYLDLIPRSQCPAPPKPKKLRTLPPNWYACYESQGDGAVLVRPCTEAETQKAFEQMRGNSE